MAKPEKTKKVAKATPGSAAYRAVLKAIEETHAEYLEGESDDADFTTPGKQRKVAKQIANHYNRILKKSKLTDLDPIEENDA